MKQNIIRKTCVSRRSFLAGASLMGLIGAGAGLGLTGCTSRRQAPEGQLEEIQFVLDYTPNTNHTGIYVAQAKGYFKKAGLEVAVVQPPEDGADALVASGKAQFGVGYQDVMASYLGSKDPLPNKAIAAILQHNTSGIMSAKSEGIFRPKDMDHHSYATWNIATERAIVKSVVDQDGGNWSTVELVPCNTTDEVASLKAHEFDTIWVYEGWAVQNAILQKFPYNYFSFRAINDVFDYYTPVIITNEKYLKDHGDTVSRFLKACRQGYDYAADHPEEAADILCKAAPELDPELVKLSQNYLANQYRDKGKQWGVIDSKRWNRFYEWMNANKLTAVPLKKDCGLDTSFID